MKRFLCLALILTCGTAFAQTKISQLPNAPTPNGSEVLPESLGNCPLTGLGSCAITIAQIEAYIAPLVIPSSLAGSPTTNQVWCYNGSIQTWCTPTAGTPGGSNFQLQWNNSGAFGGITPSATSGWPLTSGGSSAAPAFAQLANAGLVNSSVTIGSTSLSLGATAATLAGLTSVTATIFVGALTGNASTASTAGGLTGSPSITISGLDLSFVTGTQCLHSVSGVVSGTGSDCGSGGISYPSSGVALSTGLAWSSSITLGSNTFLGNIGSGAAALTAQQAIAALNSTSANAQTGTTYTFVLGDGNGEVTMSNASSNTVCLPPNSSVAYAVGTLLTVQETNTGVTTIAPAGASGCAGTGVTITSGAYGSSTSQTYSMGGVYGFIQLQQTSTNTWTVVAWDTPVGQQLRALSISSEMQAYLAAGTTFTETPTGCTPSAHSGGPFAGTITLASGPCTSIVVTMNGGTGFTDSNGYSCAVGDQTATNAGTFIPMWIQSATNSTTATIPIPAAVGATDVVSFKCSPRSL